MSNIKERVTTAKTIFVVSIVCLVGGLVANIFLKRQMPVFGATLKTLGYILAMGGMFLGAIWIVAGDKLAKLWGNKFTKIETPEVYYTPQETLVNEQMQTQIQQEKTKREQMENIIAMQKAKIDQMKAKTRVTTNNANNDVTGKSSMGFSGLGDFMIGAKPKQQQQVPKKKKKKKQKQEPIPEDNFFKW